jgi:hypothetical protein
MRLIIPIVEGQSEVRSIGVLTRRVLHGLGVFDVDVGRPFRVKRNRVVRRGEIERTVIQAQRTRPGASAIMIVLDADTDCPASLSQDLRERASTETSLLVSVVLPTLEIEAWILAGIETLRGQRGIRSDASPPDDPEAISDAKRAVSDLMQGTRGYVATDDMSALFAAIDLDLVASRAPSFDKFRRDLAGLVGA